LLGTAKQQIVNQPLILIAYRSQLGRQREHHVEILYLQQVVTSLKDPLFLIDSLALWTMTIATGVIMDLDMSTGRTDCQMTSQYISPALADIPDEFLLFKAQDAIALIVIGKAVEHLCHGSHSYCSQASNGLKALESGTSLTCRYTMVV